MKIGIVTLNGFDNYGGELQKYAVQQVLRKHSCESEVLSFLPPQTPFKENKKQWCIENAIFFIQRYIPFFGKIFSNIRVLNFIKWSNSNIRFRYFKTQKLPTNIKTEYDKFIVGSDQVWNDRFIYYNPTDFFLEFADNNQKIALAASIGNLNIPEFYKNLFKKNLPSFASISVREAEAADKINKMTGLCPQVVVDPTMMLTSQEWLEVTETPPVEIKEKYILTYFLGDDAEQNRFRKFAQNKNLKIYELYNKENKLLRSSNPGQFISLIKNAEFVCTDSFHATVFSILFHTPFVSYPIKGLGMDTSSRINTLLDKFCLSNRKIVNCPESEWLNCDFSQVNEVLDKERKIFEDFLSKALNK